MINNSNSIENLMVPKSKSVCSPHHRIYDWENFGHRIITVIRFLWNQCTRVNFPYKTNIRTICNNGIHIFFLSM